MILASDINVQLPLYIEPYTRLLFHWHLVELLNLLLTIICLLFVDRTAYHAFNVRATHSFGISGLFYICWSFYLNTACEGRKISQSTSCTLVARGWAMVLSVSVCVFVYW